MMKHSLAIVILMAAMTCMASVAFAGMDEVVAAIEEVRAAQTMRVDLDDYKLGCAKAQALVVKGRKDGSLSKDFAEEATWALNAYAIMPYCEKLGIDKHEAKKMGDESLDKLYKMMKQNS